jgi:hypothetical protein
MGMRRVGLLKVDSSSSANNSNTHELWGEMLKLGDSGIKHVRLTAAPIPAGVGHARTG